MPEMNQLIPWGDVAWDNMDQDSGGGNLVERPYYFKQIRSGEKAKIVIVSAVESSGRRGALHATDYLRLTKESFEQLKKLGNEVFGL